MPHESGDDLQDFSDGRDLKPGHLPHVVVAKDSCACKEKTIYIYACLELKGRDAKPRLQTSVVAKVINSVLVTSSRSSFLPRFRDTAMIGYGMRASGC